MGSKTRAKKRAAKNRAISATKKKHREMIAGRWYLTIVKRKTCCAVCGGILNVGREMVFRHTPREARCRLHGDELRPRPSQAWERWRRAQRK